MNLDQRRDTVKIETTELQYILVTGITKLCLGIYPQTHRYAP